MAQGLVGFKVEGARELRRIARKVEGDTDNTLRKSHRHIADIVAGTAARNVNSVTGGLEGTVRGLGSITKAQVAAGRASKPYAGVNHYGDPHRNITGNPYLIDAVETEFDDAWEFMADQYDRLARQLAT